MQSEHATRDSASIHQYAARTTKNWTLLGGVLGGLFQHLPFRAFFGLLDVKILYLMCRIKLDIMCRIKL